jgi:valyl-tRNA synthetase
MEFGTGVMTITPWHDATDFDIAERHKLDKEQIISERGLLLPIAGEFAGQHIKKARPMIVERLKEKGLLEKMDEAYSHRVATNSRGNGVIEPQIKEQWFMAVNKEFAMPHSEIEGVKRGDTVTLKKLMRHVVESSQVGIIPEHFLKTYYHWIDNLRDWCISRQIWYGHQIPVWYKNGEIHCDINPPEGDGWTQDPDTLDTWFSSGLWTFSTLGWPNDTRDLKTFHPTNVLETGYDILFFWVARMILMTTYLTGQIPFKHVYLHGLVRDKDRQKMSKSKGNIVDPLGIIDTYGTDALRFAMIFSTAAGSDIPLAEDKVKGMKHFGNKVWNIARFVFTNAGNIAAPENSIPSPQTDADKAILEQLHTATEEMTSSLQNFELHKAAQTAYDFVWYKFADVYIEASKAQLKDEALKDSTSKILQHVLVRSLTLLHPFMPFVTEEIYQKIKPGELLMIKRWPEA